MLIDTFDFIGLIEIIKSVDKIVNYSTEIYPCFDDEKEDEENRLKVDAISFHLVKIAYTIRDLNKEFKDRYPEVGWDYYYYIFCAGPFKITAEGVYDTLFDVDGVLYEELTVFKKVKESIYSDINNYAQSNELFENKMYVNDFLKWQSYKGRYYLMCWKSFFAKKNQIDASSFDIDINNIVNAWKYLDMNQSDSESKILKIGVRPYSLEYSIGDYKDAFDVLCEFAVSGEDLKDCVKDYNLKIPSKKKKKRKISKVSTKRRDKRPRIIYSKEEIEVMKLTAFSYRNSLREVSEVPFVNDFGKGITTKKSIRTVRQKY